VSDLEHFCVLSLVTARQSAKTAYCLPVANDARKRRVVAMAHCRSAQIEAFAICIYRPTSPQRAERQHAVCRASLATRRTGDND
jgi:hypothetical protein